MWERKLGTDQALRAFSDRNLKNLFKKISMKKIRTLFRWSLNFLPRHLQIQLCWVIFTHLVTFEQLQTTMLREKKHREKVPYFECIFDVEKKVESDLLLAARNWVRYKRKSISWHRGRRTGVFLLHFFTLYFQKLFKSSDSIQSCDRKSAGEF